MAHTTIEQFATELKIPPGALLEQLGRAGLAGKKEGHVLSEQRKTKKEREAEEAAAKAAAEAEAAATAQAAEEARQAAMQAAQAEAKAMNAAQAAPPKEAKVPAATTTLHRPAAKPGEKPKPVKK